MIVGGLRLSSGAMVFLLVVWLALLSAVLFFCAVVLFAHIVYVVLWWYE